MASIPYAFATNNKSAPEVVKPPIQTSAPSNPAAVAILDKNGAPVWPTEQQNVLEPYGLDEKGFYHSFATLPADASEEIQAVFSGVIESNTGDSVSVRSKGVTITYGNVDSDLKISEVVNSGETLGVSKGDISLSAENGSGLKFDPVVSFWPEISQLAEQGDTASDKKPEVKKKSEAQQRNISYSTGIVSVKQKNVSIYRTICPADEEQVFEAAAKQYGVDVALIKAVAGVESGFNPLSTSPAGAIGVMQLMPGTAIAQGVTEPYDFVQNVYGGARYLKQLLVQFNGDLNCTLAAYNAGPGAVREYGGIPPYEETQNYVTTVLGLYNSLKKTS